MLRRLRIYFTGFGLGLIAVYLIFSKSDDRNLDIWTPSQRILEDIRNDSIFQESKALDCYQNCLKLSDDYMKELWTEGKTKSLNPGGDPYRYLISMANDDKHIEAEIEWQKGNSRTLISMRDMRNPIDCNCDQ